MSSGLSILASDFSCASVSSYLLPIKYVSMLYDGDGFFNVSFVCLSISSHCHILLSFFMLSTLLLLSKSPKRKDTNPTKRLPAVYMLVQGWTWCVFRDAAL